MDERQELCRQVIRLWLKGASPARAEPLSTALALLRGERLAGDATREAQPTLA